MSDIINFDKSATKVIRTLGGDPFPMSVRFTSNGVVENLEGNVFYFAVYNGATLLFDCGMGAGIEVVDNVVHIRRSGSLMEHPAGTYSYKLKQDKGSGFFTRLRGPFIIV